MVGYRGIDEDWVLLEIVICCAKRFWADKMYAIDR
jgi:hypothetical protein